MNKKNKCKKYLVLLILISSLSSCNTILRSAGIKADVSNKSPHNKLVDTVWRLKNDAYIIEYYGDKRNYLVVNRSATAFLSSKWEKSYNENYIGETYGGRKLIGGLKKGELITIIKVKKELGDFFVAESYLPIAIPVKTNRWTGNQELNLDLYYSNFSKGGWDLFYKQGILNPEYAERVK